MHDLPSKPLLSARRRVPWCLVEEHPVLIENCLGMAGKGLSKSVADYGPRAQPNQAVREREPANARSGESIDMGYFESLF